MEYQSAARLLTNHNDWIDETSYDVVAIDKGSWRQPDVRQWQADNEYRNYIQQNKSIFRWVHGILICRRSVDKSEWLH